MADREFKTEDELVEYIKKDLARQRSEGIAEEDLVINIRNLSSEKIIIDFDFTLINILYKLFLGLHLYLDKIDGGKYESNYIVNCEYVEFKREFSCFGTRFNKKTNFSNSTFNSETNFFESIFNGEANFDDLIFEAKTSFYKSIFNGKTNFKRSTFKNEANFNHSTFDCETAFLISTFDCKIDFLNCNFNRDIDFCSLFSNKIDLSNSTFNGKAYFMGSVFNDKMDFSRSKIANNIKLEYIHLKDKNVEINFDNIQFENDKSKLSISLDKNNTTPFKKMSFRNILINGIIDIQNVKTQNIDFDCSYVSGIFSMSNFKIENFAKWHSARFLKNEAIKINNNIEALEYKAKEVELYKDEIFEELKRKPSFKKIAEYISILINGFFSEHGQNWIRALVTTLILGFAIYFIFYIDLNSFSNLKTELQKVAKSFVSYIIPTNFEIITKYMGKEYINFFVRMCGVFVYFLGKITMWYGSVQIVSAFRKYNKY